MLFWKALVIYLCLQIILEKDLGNLISFSISIHTREWLFLGGGQWNEVFPWTCKFPDATMGTQAAQWQWQILNPVSPEGTPLGCSLFWFQSTGLFFLVKDKIPVPLQEGAHLFLRVKVSFDKHMQKSGALAHWRLLQIRLLRSPIFFKDARKEESRVQTWNLKRHHRCHLWCSYTQKKWRVGFQLWVHNKRDTCSIGILCVN